MTDNKVKVIACWNYATEIINQNSNLTGAIAGSDPNSTSTYDGCFWKKEDGLQGVGNDASIINPLTNTFTGDAPTSDLINIMNNSWQTKDPSRKYQFNPATGEIEPIP